MVDFFAGFLSCFTLGLYALAVREVLTIRKENYNEDTDETVMETADRTIADAYIAGYDLATTKED